MPNEDDVSSTRGSTLGARLEECLGTLGRLRNAERL
jgi:hypothetical protein